MNFSTDLRAARNGSKEALGRLLVACQAYLATVAARKAPPQLPVHSQSVLVQETLCRAWQGFSQFEGSTEPELLGWLRKILLNIIRNLVRKPERKKVHLGLPADLVGREELPEKRLIDAENAADVHRVLAYLEPEERLIIELHQRERLGWVEIGRLLDRKPDCIRKQWVRLLVKLGKDLPGDQ